MNTRYLLMTKTDCHAALCVNGLIDPEDMKRRGYDFPVPCGLCRGTGFLVGEIQVYRRPATNGEFVFVECPEELRVAENSTVDGIVAHLQSRGLVN